MAMSHLTTLQEGNTFICKSAISSLKEAEMWRSRFTIREDELDRRVDGPRRTEVQTRGLDLVPPQQFSQAVTAEPKLTPRSSHREA